jgi:hypothetical protein
MLTENKATPPEIPVSARIFHPIHVFINDLTRFVAVELEETSTAFDVLETVKARGELHEETRVGEEVGGEWMLWELANESGVGKSIPEHFTHS